MKLLFTQTQRGYSWHNECRYYICESEQEYKELADQYRDYENSVTEFSCGMHRVYPRHVQWYVDVKISCEPQTIVSDGFAVRGGKTLRCMGIKKKTNGGGISHDTSSYDYYINPATIEQYEDENPQSWWV
jgi:hypothetical protein